MPGAHDPAYCGASHHGRLLLLPGANVVYGVLPVLAVHVHLKSEHNHGDGEAGQRDYEHAAQGVECDAFTAIEFCHVEYYPL